MSKPYIITSLSLVTYGGRVLPVDLFDQEIIDQPVRLVEDRVLKAFASMKDQPVKVNLKVKYV